MKYQRGSFGLRVVAGLLAAFVSDGGATAQWTAISLHPSNSMFQSEATGVDGGQQAGIVYIGNFCHGSVWSGSAASWVNLTPSGALGSYVHGAQNGQQVGNVNGRPSLWSGTAASWVDLTPIGATDGDAWGIHGGQQVGDVAVGNEHHASLWSGSAASWVDLHPLTNLSGTADEGSWALGVSADQQVGIAMVFDAFFNNEQNHASLWRGTAASWVDLHPTGTSWENSEANDVDAGQQVGWISRNLDGAQHACLWTGTAESFVDLHPVGADYSYAYGVHDGEQVGWVILDFLPHASIWSGTAESWINLHSFLPPEYTHSYANAISGDESATYVVGMAWNSQTEQYEAVMWTRSKANTPVGQDVSVKGLSFGAFIQFGTVDGEGDTRVAATGSSSLPSNFEVVGGSFFEITTTATFSDGIFVKLQHAGLSDPRLLHYENGSWIDVTSGHDGTHVWGTVSSLSPFAVANRLFTYAWSGVLQPVNADGSSIFKLGRTVPVKFRLTGDFASVTDLPARLYAAKVSDGIVGTETEAISTSSADAGNLFRYSDGMYVFNLGTGGLSVGTWQLRFDLGDGVMRTVLVSLKT